MEQKWKIQSIELAGKVRQLVVQLQQGVSFYLPRKYCSNIIIVLS